MSTKNTVECSDATWNPILGCDKISPGCDHCYAETSAERFRGVLGHPLEQGFDLRLVPEKLIEPFRWQRSRRICVGSMSDLFHERVPLDYIALVARVMRQANWHVYQVLTKRAARLDVVSQLIDLTSPNIIVGVSVEDREHGVPRIWQLRHAKVEYRYLSIEPLLEDLGELELWGIDWVVVGGESGPGARPMNSAWVRRIRQNCLDQRVPFYFKGWGGVRKTRKGRLLDGRTYDAIPQMTVLPGLGFGGRQQQIQEILRLHRALNPQLRPGLQILHQSSSRQPTRVAYPAEDSEVTEHHLSEETIS